MDWVLSISTLITNSALGWSKGASWSWFAQGINSIAWVWYSIVTDQQGFILLSVATLGIAFVSGIKVRKGKKDVIR